MVRKSHPTLRPVKNRSKDIKVLAQNMIKVVNWFCCDNFVANIFFAIFHLRAVEKIYLAQIKQFGRRIKRLREANLLSQQELAHRCEVDIRTIQRIERGDYGVGLHILLALASAFNLSPSQLLSGIKIIDLQ